MRGICCVKNYHKIKYLIGVKLLKLGSNLCFNSDSEKETLKDAINRNTTIGSYIESGDHIRGSVKPMCDYDTKSVINVLNNELLIKDDIAFCGEKTSEKVAWYDERWI